MKFPWYKILLSYFTDLTLEETTSEINSKLFVYLSRGRIKLSTINAVYSEADHYYNFTEVFEQLNIQNNNLKTSLVLGLGLGSIPYMLEKKFKSKYFYDLVELDKEIIRLFFRYVKEDLNSQMNIIHADANEFMMRNTKKYDLICVDLFIDRVVPNNFESIEFISYLKKAMNLNGVLIFNRLLEQEEDRIKNLQFDKILTSIFPNRKIIKVKYNEMYVVR